MERVAATCRRCLRAESELIYLSDQRYYCWPCAQHVHEKLVAAETADGESDDQAGSTPDPR